MEEKKQITLQGLNKSELVIAYTKANYTLIPLKGKIPVSKDWVKTEYKVDLTADELPGNYGVVLREDDLIVDVDVRHFPEGRNVLKELQLATGMSFNTFMVKTGGGGLHIYYKKPKDFVIRGSLKDFPGIEFKTKGQQIVAAGSIHPETHKSYEILRDAFKPIPADQSLLDFIKQTEIDLTKLKMDFSDSEANILRYVKYLQGCSPAVEGEGGDVQTFKVACRGRDFALSAQKTFELMAEHFNPRCLPVWELEELKKKVDNAYKYNSDIVGKNTAESDFEKVLTLEEETLGSDEENLKWDVDKSNGIKPTIRNVVNYLLCKDYPFLGMIKLNDFTNDITFTKPAPWHNGRIPGTWTDTDSINLKYWLSKVRCFNVPTALCQEAAVVAAGKFRYHPVREYLKTLEWDGVKRLDMWLKDFCGVVDNPYTRAIGKKTLVGAVARVLNPGVKFDTMLVLEGEQGIGKSTVVSILGGEWYTDISITDNDKDTIDAMRGSWITEVSEMVCARKVDSDKLKSFLSKTVDRVRLAYRRNAEDIPRQGIFIGTINPEEGTGYLRDQTGNRRFWPVLCHRIDTKGLREVRDQLFAEAISEYIRGEKLYLESELCAMATAETQKRMITDPWVDVIEDWVLNRVDPTTRTLRDIVTSTEILEECIGISVARITRSDNIRVANVMIKELGWEKGSFYSSKSGKTVRGYRKPRIDLAELGLL